MADAFTTTAAAAGGDEVDDDVMEADDMRFLRLRQIRCDMAIEYTVPRLRRS